MGMHANQATLERLVECLADNDRTIRRKACESLARADQGPPVERLLKLLASDDRYEAWAARRILERMAVEEWRDQVLQSKNPRLLVQGGLALVTADPTREHALEVLEQISQEAVALKVLGSYPKAVL